MSLATIKERPILFSTGLIPALLDGRKTQTRRVAKLPDRFHLGAAAFDKNPHGDEDFVIYGGCGEHKIDCPYGRVGDRLWVREAFSAWFEGYHWRDTNAEHRRPTSCSNLFYRATHHFPDNDQKWVPGIFMPRWASRVTLEITEVRVERLQSISEADAVAEGVDMSAELYVCPECGFVDDDFQDGDGHWEKGTTQSHEGVPGWSDWTLACNGCGKVNDMPLATGKERFRALWDKINGKPEPYVWHDDNDVEHRDGTMAAPKSWASNPWVWAISFRRIEQWSDKP